MPRNYGADAQFSNNQMVDFRTFSQSQGYGTSIAPSEINLYSLQAVDPGNAAFQNDPTVITFYDTVTTDIITQVQDPVIRNGNQVPTQVLLGIYGVALEVNFPRNPAGATDIIDALYTYSQSVFEMTIAGDRQFMAKGSQLININGTTPGVQGAAQGFGQGSASAINFHVWPSSKLVMPGSTLRATLQLDGSNAATWQTVDPHDLTLHVLAFEARR